MQNAGFLGNQRVALALEKSIWASFHGQAPDPGWAGRLSGAQFFELIGQLVELLTTREPDGSSILAERLNAMGFPGHYSTGAEQPAIALGALGWLERRQLMRVLAMVLLGPGSRRHPHHHPSCAGRYRPDGRNLCQLPSLHRHHQGNHCTQTLFYFLQITQLRTYPKATVTQL